MLLRSAGISECTRQPWSHADLCAVNGYFDPSEMQSNLNIVPGVASPFAATPSKINPFSVSTAAPSGVRGATPSAMAAATFSAPPLKFIFKTNVVVWYPRRTPWISEAPKSRPICPILRRRRSSP